MVMAHIYTYICILGNVVEKYKYTNTLQDNLIQQQYKHNLVMLIVISPFSRMFCFVLFCLSPHMLLLLYNINALLLDHFGNGNGNGNGVSWITIIQQYGNGLRYCGIWIWSICWLYFVFDVTCNGGSRSAAQQGMFLFFIVAFSNLIFICKIWKWTRMWICKNYVKLNLVVIIVG